MFVKRIMDVLGSLPGLLIAGVPLLFFWLGAAIATRSGGMFLQQRIGRWGKPFTIYKLRTMHLQTGYVNRYSAFLRRTKIDELPQLWNVLIGDMSLVGPRPDLPGYYDRLTGENRRLLDLRPGITGPASLKYSDEDSLLSRQPDPLAYNDAVIFPDKIKINMAYYRNRSLWLDVKIILYTVSGRKYSDNFFKN